MRTLQSITAFVLLISSLLIILSCGNKTASTLSDSAEDNLESYKLHNTDTYSIEYPDTWNLTSLGEHGSSFMIKSPQLNEDDNFLENVNLVIQDLSGMDMDIEKFSELSLSQVKEYITDSKIIQDELKSDGKNKYHQLYYTGKFGIYTLRFNQHCWVIGDTAYVLTCTGKNDEYNVYEKTMMRILHSFELNNY